jgi:hypothetical protein
LDLLVLIRFASLSSDFDKVPNFKDLGKFEAILKDWKVECQEVQEVQGGPGKPVHLA